MDKFRNLWAVAVLLAFVVALPVAAEDLATHLDNRLLSSGNSTASALAAAGTFLGAPVESHAFSWASVTVSTDVIGSIYVDTSKDGTNWTSRPMVICVPGFLPCARSLSRHISAALTRIRYLNGPVPQGHLRIETVFHSGTPPQALPSPHPIHGEFFTDAMTTGEVELPANDARDVWGFPTAVDFAAAPGTVDIVSDSAEDNPAGDGAAVVLVAGASAVDGELIIEFVTLNGVTPVTTTNAYKVPLADLSVIAVGSGGGANEFGTSANGQTGEVSSAAGIITATLTAGGESMARIRQDLGKNQSLGANAIIAHAFGGHELVLLVRAVIISTRDITAQGAGQFTVDFLAKRPGSPVRVLSVPFEGATNQPGTQEIAVNEALRSGELLITRGISDKALTLGVTYLVRVYIPAFECTGDCS